MPTSSRHRNVLTEAQKSKNMKGKNFLLFHICAWRNGAEEETGAPSCCHPTMGPKMTQCPVNLCHRHWWEPSGQRHCPSLLQHRGSSIMVSSQRSYRFYPRPQPTRSSHNTHTSLGGGYPCPPKSAVLASKEWKKGKYILR